MTPQRIGPYQLLGELGRGGVGAVFRALDPVGNQVAIKVVERRRERSDARFAREVRLLSDLADAGGFVPLLDAGEVERYSYLTMPILTGGTLAQRLPAEGLPVDGALALVEGLARSMGRAHEAGIVHRDLKLANVLFPAEGPPLIADLGLAKHFLGDAPGADKSVVLSRTGEIGGTPGYMAPEQLQDSKRADARADVFALGVILFECLTGQRPFRGPGLVELVGELTQAERPSVRRARPGVPPWLDAVVKRALAIEPDDRYPDAGALADALAQGEDAGTRKPARAVALALGLVLAVVTAWFAAERDGVARGDDAELTTESPHESPVDSAQGPAAGFGNERLDDPERGPDELPAWTKEFQRGRRLRLVAVHGRSGPSYGDTLIFPRYQPARDEIWVTAGWSRPGLLAVDPATGADRGVRWTGDIVSHMTLTADGKRVAYVTWRDRQHVIRLHDLEHDEQVLEIVPPQRNVSAIAFGPRDRLLFVAHTPSGTHMRRPGEVARDQYTLEVYAVDNGSRVAQLDGHRGTSLRGPFLSADGKQVATTSEDGMIQVWSWPPSGPAREFDVGQDGLVLTVWRPGEGAFVSVYADGAIRRADAGSGEVTLLGRCPRKVSAVFLESEGPLVTGHADGTVCAVDLDQGQVLWRARGPAEAVVEVCLTGDARVVATYEGSPTTCFEIGQDEPLAIWTQDSYRATRSTNRALKMHPLGRADGVVRVEGCRLVRYRLPDGARVWSATGLPRRVGAATVADLGEVVGVLAVGDWGASVLHGSAISGSLREGWASKFGKTAVSSRLAALATPSGLEVWRLASASAVPESVLRVPPPAVTTEVSALTLSPGGARVLVAWAKPIVSEAGVTTGQRPTVVVYSLDPPASEEAASEPLTLIDEGEKRVSAATWVSDDLVWLLRGDGYRGDPLEAWSLRGSPRRLAQTELLNAGGDSLCPWPAQPGGVLLGPSWSSRGESLRLLDASGELVREIPRANDSSAPLVMAPSPDGRWLALLERDAGEVVLLDPTREEPEVDRLLLTSAFDRGSSLSWTEDSRRLVVGTDRGQILVYEVE